jgi:acylphosphatase
MAAMQRIIVHGRVQGVNFRSFVEDEASSRRLDGWVRNLADGTVEAVFSGPDADVAAVIARCRIGPRHADVTQLETFPASERDLKLRNAGEKFSRLG